MNFENKVVIVTGSSSGIGAATAISFSKHGANVVIVGRNETKLNNVAASCEGRYLIVKADVSKEDEAKHIVGKTIEEFGKIDILVNNAGIVRYGSLAMENFLEAYDEVMATNMRAVIHVTSLCAPYIIETKGNIINVSSIGGISPPYKPALLPYCISKAALNIFSQGMAAELSPFGVRVNTVSPGPVMTDIMTNSGLTGSSASWDNFKSRTALDRVSDAEEIADLIMFIASEKGRGITGSNYVSDNGMLLKH